MTPHYDDLETRTSEQRASDRANALPKQIARAQMLPGYEASLANVEATEIVGEAALTALPVLRKSALMDLQKAAPPFGA